MAEKEEDLLVDEEDQAPDAPELAIAQKKRALGTYVGAFFDELMRAGVRDVVVSPGSRSTPLSMVAHEAHARFGSAFNLYLDIDERGAAFFALGIAKATGRAVCVICTSGTALANYYPAVMEAEISRVPLIVLSGDRPARLQGLGAPQTCDQNKAFSDHVRRFFAMPEPSDSPKYVAHVRQVARETVIAAAPGTHASAPVHVNFPFDEPLVPDTAMPDLFDAGRVAAADDLPALVRTEHELSSRDAASLIPILWWFLPAKEHFLLKRLQTARAGTGKRRRSLLLPSVSMPLCLPTRFPTCARTATLPLSADTIALWGRMKCLPSTRWFALGAIRCRSAQRRQSKPARPHRLWWIR